ncbi:MAG TPA: L,D-transpeptidase family protein [Blastocatellia bacterium]
MTFNLIPLSLALGIILSSGKTMAQDFKSTQSKHPRVKTALAEKEASVKRLFEQRGIPYPPRRVFLRAFKRERIIELWVSRAESGAFELLKQYPFCASSGALGPKRRQGDGQIPEGFYHIDRFNPASNFYLSLGLNYPNQSDRILGASGKWGGDIFIHGDCVTIGCIPITDDLIKELYLIAIEARSAGQREIPVHLFPTRMNESGMKILERQTADSALRAFWTNIKEGYDFFEKNHRLPAVTVDRQGRYQFK